MRKLALGLISAFLAAFLTSSAGAQSTAAAAPVRQVILVQNSGWMEPFYLDPRSQLRQLVTSLASQSNLKGVEVIIASFNQDGQIPGRTSPQVLWQGPFDPAKVEAAAKAIDLPRKPSGAYADADFHGALQNTITKVLNGGEGVIWMITNNKDSPNNSADVVNNTQQFYGLLRGSPYITRIVAFPIRNNLAGPNFQERGFIIYGLAYGQRAARALDAILADGAPTRALFGSPPVRLKPLDQRPVELRLSAVGHSSGVAATVNGGTLTLKGVKGGQAASVVLEGNLVNRYYPQNIDAAALSVAWRSDNPELAQARVSISPAHIEKLKANGGATPVTLTIELPAVKRASLLESERALTGVLSIQLDQIAFSLDPEFVDRIAAVTATDSIRESQSEALVSAQLPALFLDYKKVADAATQVPVVAMIDYSALPLIGLLSAAGLLVGGGGFFALWATRARSYPVTIGAGSQNVSIKPFENRIVSDGFGVRGRVTGSMFGPPTVRSVGDD